MDFSALALDVDKPYRMPIEYPGRGVLKDQDGKEAYLELLSLDSEASSNLDRQLNKQAGKLGDDFDIGLERLVALTVGWYLVSPDGNPIEVPYSKENARKLFAANSMNWLRKRAALAVATEENFTPKTSSD